MRALSPLHRSRRAEGRPISPAGLSSIAMTIDQIEAIESVSLDVFTAVCNAGGTIQQALAAVYLSGLEHALTCGRG